VKRRSTVTSLRVPTEKNIDAAERRVLLAKKGSAVETQPRVQRDLRHITSLRSHSGRFSGLALFQIPFEDIVSDIQSNPGKVFLIPDDVIEEPGLPGE
jgi:hypothetical protein